MEIEKVERKGWGYQSIDEVYALEDSSEIAEFTESHKRRKLICLEVLKGWSKSRDNDRLLDFECLRVEFPEIQVTSSQENIIFKIPRKIIKILPSPESFSRARRSLILEAIKDNDVELVKELLPTDKRVLEKRSKRERAIMTFFHGANSQ